MRAENPRAVAVWMLFLVAFVVFAATLWRQGDLTVPVVALYWFPAVVLVLVGVLPPPWAPLRE